MKQEPERSSVVWHVVVSAYLGILFVCVALTLLPFILGDGTARPANPHGLSGIGLIAWALGVLILGALVVTLPLVAAAVTVGLAFDESIRRYPGRWSVAAPVIVWILASGLIAMIGWSAESASFVARMWAILSTTEALGLVLAATPSAVIFYWLSHRKERAGSL